MASKILNDMYDHKFAPSSPLLESKLNAPVLKKQLSFRFHLDESSSFSEGVHVAPWTRCVHKTASKTKGDHTLSQLRASRNTN